MTLITGPEKGQSAELNITEKSQERVLIGLAWDPNTLDKIQEAKQILRGVDDVLFGKIHLFKANVARISEKMDTESRETDDQNFDLDLSCFAFDRDGNFQSLVDPNAWHAIDTTGKIYHTGDDPTGHQGPDDEQIHIELKDLPDNLHEFFIVVQSDCAHSFDKIKNAEIRIADSFTNTNILQSKLNIAEGNNKYGFVYCRIYKQNNNWMIENISKFCEFDEEWPIFLQNLKKA